MRLKEIMNHPVITCPETSTLDHAARLMWEFDCGVIPVVNDDGRLAGIVTDRDVCMAAYTQGRPLAAIPIGTAMARDVVASHEEDSVEHAEALMRASQVRRVPILDGDGRPVGIVSLNDLARLALRAHRGAVDRELVQTMAAVCEPRHQAAPSRPALVMAPAS